MTDGDDETARGRFEQARAMLEAMDDPMWVALALNCLGLIARRQRQPGRAAALLDESLALCRRIDATWAAAEALDYRGDLARDAGDHAAAMRDYQESLAIYQDERDLWGICDQLAQLGISAAVSGQPGSGARLCAAADVFRETIGLRPMSRATFGADWAPALATARSALGEHAFDEGWRRGRAMGLEQAIEDALALSIVPAKQPTAVPLDDEHENARIIPFAPRPRRQRG